jgi:protein AFG1
MKSSSPQIVLREWQRVCQQRGLVEDQAQKAVATLFDDVLHFPTQHQFGGCYLHGTVGTGKTLLLDCFHQSLPSSITSKRIHFCEFMLDVHQRLHRTKSMHETVLEIARQNSILCFDEFQVTDVGDAVLLHQLFQGLFAQRTFVVATSNRAPDKLYENGINREALFVPFQRLLERRCLVVNINALGAHHDYRAMQPESQVYVPSIVSPVDIHKMDALFAVQTKQEHNMSKIIEIPVAMGRTLRGVSFSLNGVARTTFQRLCQEPLGSGDYLALSKHCHTLFLDDIPVLDSGMHNEARRFITLVDILYDRKICLVASSARPLESIFQDVGVNVQLGCDLRVDTDRMMDRPSTLVASRSTTMLSNKVEWSATGRMHVSLAELSGVRDVTFAYRRALSRLMEMSSSSYWSAADRLK